MVAMADVDWLHTDLNRAPLEVTDVEGNLCWSGNYDTFGKLQGRRSPASNVAMWRSPQPDVEGITLNFHNPIKTSLLPF